jgi:hypothetical protein
MVTPIKKFDIPDEIIVDLKTGYAINIPLQHQGFAGVFDVPSDVWENIQEARKEFGITINDFPSGSKVEDQ